MLKVEGPVKQQNWKLPSSYICYVFIHTHYLSINVAYISQYYFASLLYDPIIFMVLQRGLWNIFSMNGKNLFREFLGQILYILMITIA